MQAPAWKIAGPRIFPDSFIRKPSHKPRTKVNPRKTRRNCVYWTCRWNEAKTVACSTFEDKGPRNLPYFLRKSPLNQNSSLKPLESTRINIAGVSVRNRDGGIPLLGNNDWSSPESEKTEKAKGICQYLSRLRLRLDRNVHAKRKPERPERK